MEFEQNGSSENLLGLESPEDHQENVIFDWQNFCVVAVGTGDRRGSLPVGRP